MVQIEYKTNFREQILGQTMRVITKSPIFVLDESSCSKYVNVSSTKSCRDAFLRLGKQDCRIKSPVAKTWQLAETQECVSTVW